MLWKSGEKISSLSSADGRAKNNAENSKEVDLSLAG